MTAPTRGRSTRDRPAKAPLSVEVIVDTAMAIIENEGLDALSMRRVATALDTGAGSLYVYVSGRDALVEAVSDRITAAVELEPPNPDQWREQLHSLLRRMRDGLIRYPGIAAATMIDPPRTEVVMGLLENLFGILLAGGIEPQDAAWVADVMAAQVTYAAIEAQLRGTDTDEMARQVEQNFDRLSSTRFPLITAHAAELVAGDVDTRFRFAIDVVIDGVLSRAAKRANG